MSLFWILLAPAVGKWFARASKLSRRLPARWSYSNRIRPLSRSMTARCSAAPQGLRFICKYPPEWSAAFSGSERKSLREAAVLIFRDGSGPR